MSEKKHIDRLFQEKLKDFEATPDDAVWDTIHDRLHKDKRKRRAIPIWWKFAGVAALLALLLTVGIKLSSTDFDSDSTNPVVDIEKQSSEKSSNETDNTIQQNSNATNGSNELNTIEDQIDNSSNVATENGSNSKDGFNGNSNEFNENTENNDRGNTNKNNNSEKNRANQKLSTVKNSSKNKIVNTNNSDENRNSSQGNSDGKKNSNRTSKENNNTKNSVVTSSKNNQNNSNQNNPENPNIKKEKSEIDKLIKDSKNDTKSAVTNSSEYSDEKVSEQNSSEEKKEDTKNDQSIEDAIADATTEDEKEKKLNRWNISPNVAPVYFNSLGNGSTLDEQFVDNTKSGEVTMSYGIGGSYAINDRLKVRAGINKVDMGYNTNNVIAFRSIDSTSQARSQLSNVSINTDGGSMVYLSTESLNRNSTPEIINSKAEGSLNQRFGFIEVPMEVEYAVINKKLGVNVIGGFSTFIVDKNEIYSVVNGIETNIGEANNINNLSYSANLGLGINYHISEKIKVNVEPTFKYQINTFSKSSGDVQPYFIGVYTGLSYKF